MSTQTKLPPGNLKKTTYAVPHPPRGGAGRSVVQPSKPTGLRLALTCLALVVLVVAAYGNSASNGFVWDDHEEIVLNGSMKSGAPLAPIFSSDVRFTAHTQGVQGKDYRPLQMLTYWLLFKADAAADATAFHIVSIAFAAACALAAFAVFWWLTRRWAMAAAAAALFAVHPLHTEAVDWIVALDDPGFVLFVLLAFFGFLVTHSEPAAYDSAEPAQRRTRWLPASLSWLAFATAMLWKEASIIFPLLVMGYVLLMDRFGATMLARVRTALLLSAPYWLVLAGYLAVRASVLGGLSAGLRDWALTPLQFALNALYLMVLYWAKLALPIGLNAYCSFTPIRSLTDPRGIVAIIVVLAAAAGLIWLLRRMATTEGGPFMARASRDMSGLTTGARVTHPLLRLALFAALWVIIALLPAMNLSALGRNAFAERYTYLSTAGFCLLLVLAATWALERLPTDLRTPTGATLLAIVVVGFTAETIVRNADWKDDATLFSATLKRSPDAPFVRNMVAVSESADMAQSNQAEQNYRQALALAHAQVPMDSVDAVVAYQGLANVLADREDFQQALQTIAEAGKIDPDDPNLAAERGMILARAGDGKDAQPLLQQALAEDPNNENALAAMGLVARDTLHDTAQAIALFTRALAVHTAEDDCAASQHNNLGAAYADAGNFPAAIAQMSEAVRILPSDPGFHVNLATAYAASGRFTEARQEAQIATQIAPNDPNVNDLLQKLQAVGH
jgi:tetratricopeptide (TPR) repeat protein